MMQYLFWILRDLKYYWRTLSLLLAPILLLPVVLCWDIEPRIVARCAYIALLMAVYWVTEVVPISVTALIPLFAFPLMGIQPASQVSLSYMPDISFLIIGGLIAAIAIEQVNLHRRIALMVLYAMGSQLRWIMLGIMLTSAILSAFISNTATTAMMTPIVLMLAYEIIQTERRAEKAASNGSETLLAEDGKWKEAHLQDGGIVDEMAEDRTLRREELSTSELRMTKLLLLSICYSASIGGTATLTGTGPNLVMTQILNDRYINHPIDYASWFGYNCPGMFINIFLAWTWLQLFFLGPKGFLSCKGSTNPKVRQMIKAELNKLGSPNWAEISVIMHFLLLLFLWLLRKPLWGRVFMFGSRKQYVSDGTSAMFVAFLLFLWPIRCPDFLCFNSRYRRRDAPPELRTGIVTWEAVEKKFPWGIIIFIGGSFALGKGMGSSGLSEFIGNQIMTLSVNNLQMCFLTMLLTTVMTEFTSNTATSSILIPIILTIAESRCVNPLYFTLPVARTASFAFTLPVATPPNAIVYQAGILRVRDMILVGVIMNLLCMCEVLLSLHTWGAAMFGLYEWPAWAGNNTAC